MSCVVSHALRRVVLRVTWSVNAKSFFFNIQGLRFVRFVCLSFVLCIRSEFLYRSSPHPDITSTFSVSQSFPHSATSHVKNSCMHMNNKFSTRAIASWNYITLHNVNIWTMKLTQNCKRKKQTKKTKKDKKK